MEGRVRHTLHKNERLCSKVGITGLISKGKHGNVDNFHFCYLLENKAENNRVLISVPKKFFKRAVKRNLLKRRIRECWRKQKHNLNKEHTDILISYSTKEILEYKEIYDSISKIIERINKVEIKGSNEKLA